MSRIVSLTCKNCNISFSVQYKQRKRVFCSRTCVNVFQTGEGNPSYGKTYRTKENNPEWAMKISRTHIDRGYILGEKNPMKITSVASKMGKTRTQKFKNDENFRKKVSEYTKKAWEDGKFDGVQVGKCKWYSFTKQDGAVCKLQGTWELAYANWLDEQSIEFISHKGRISYFDENGVKRSYYPDFYLPKSEEYIDIKNEYHFSLNEKKWEMIKKSNPELKIKLIFQNELKKMGIL
jgi:hypothetical protein